MDLPRRRVRGHAPPGFDRGFEPGLIGAELLGERLEEGNARADRRFTVARENLAGERNARGFPTAGQELLAEVDQARRALLRGFSSIAPDKGTASICDTLQHVTEKGGIHRTQPFTCPY